MRQTTSLAGVSRLFVSYDYGAGESFLRYAYSYLLNRKQYVRISNIYSDILNVILGVPQGPIFGSTLFNCFLMTFLRC